MTVWRQTAAVDRKDSGQADPLLTYRRSKTRLLRSSCAHEPIACFAQLLCVFEFKTTQPKLLPSRPYKLNKFETVLVWIDSETCRPLTQQTLPVCQAATDHQLLIT